MPKRDRRPILVGIQFDDDAIAIQYINPSDVKVNRAQLHQTVFVPRDDDYDDEISDIEDKVQYLIADIAEDWAQLKSVDEAKAADADEEDD